MQELRAVELEHAAAKQMMSQFCDAFLCSCCLVGQGRMPFYCCISKIYLENTSLSICIVRLQLICFILIFLGSPDNDLGSQLHFVNYRSTTSQMEPLLNIFKAKRQEVCFKETHLSIRGIYLFTYAVLPYLRIV